MQSFYELMPISSILDAHINPTGSIPTVIQKLNSFPDESIESEAEELGAYLQTILSSESVPKESIQNLLVAFDKRVIDPLSCCVRLPICAKILGKILEDSLLSLSIDKREKSACDKYDNDPSYFNEIVRTMLCYSVSACIYLSQTIGLTGLIRALDTYLPKDTVSDLIIQRCLFSRLFTPNMEILLRGVDTICDRRRYTTLSTAMSISSISVAKEITSHLMIHRSNDFIQLFVFSLEIGANNISAISQQFTIETLVQYLVKHLPCEVFSSSGSLIDAFVNYVVESNCDSNLAFMTIFYSCFFAWLFSFHSDLILDPDRQDCWALLLLDKLVTVMTMCTRATKRFLLILCACFVMISNSVMTTFICGQDNRPQSASIGADLNLSSAIQMKIIKAIRMFMQASLALEPYQLCLIDAVIPYVQSLILSDKDEALKHLNTITDTPVIIDVTRGFIKSLVSRNDILLHIIANNVTFQGITTSIVRQPNSGVASTKYNTIANISNEVSVNKTDASTTINSATIANIGRIAHTSLPDLLIEIFGQEPISSELLSNLHKSIPKSLEEAISLLQYPSGQAQSRYYHMLSLASLPPILKNTSQIIIISKAQELLDSILWLDDIATLKTIKGKSAWHALKARSIAGAIERAPYVLGTTLIETSLQKHKATVGGFVIGLHGLTAASSHLTPRQILCLIGTLNQRSHIFFNKGELTEPVFFALASLVDVISRSSDRQTLCCVPLCCNNYINYIVWKCLSSTTTPIQGCILKGEKIFMATLIHACSQTTNAIKLLLSELAKQNNLSDQSRESPVPTQFLLTDIKSLEHTIKSFSLAIDKIHEISEEEGRDIYLGNIIYNTNTALAEYQSDYIVSLRGFDVIDKITQTITDRSPIDIECRSLLRGGADSILDFFGFKDRNELLLKAINDH